MKRLFVSALTIGGFMLFGMQAAEPASSPNPVRRAVSTCSRVKNPRGRAACFRSYCGRIKSPGQKRACFGVSKRYVKGKGNKVVKSLKRRLRKVRKGKRNPFRKLLKKRKGRKGRKNRKALGRKIRKGNKRGRKFCTRLPKPARIVCLKKLKRRPAN